MIELDISGFGPLALQHLVLDYNGTLAVGGDVLPGVRERIDALSGQLAVHVLTADTFGKARVSLADWPLRVEVLSDSPEDRAKLAYVDKLGPESCCFMGNGRNDCLALEASALGVALIQAEGAAATALAVADIVCPDIRSALDLLLNPLRIRACLRI